MRRQLFYSLSTSLLLVACQSTPPLSSSQAPATQALSITQVQSTQRRHTLLSTQQSPVGKMTITPEVNAPDKARVSVQITMPKLSADFSTQALAVNTVTKVQAELRGLGIDTPIYADEADGNGFVTNPGGTFTLNFSNVPYGSARRLVLGAFDANDTLIPGATVSTGFHLSSTTTTVEMSFRTSLLGDVLDLIDTFAGGLSGRPTTGSQASDHHMLSTLNLTTLQAFIDTLIGISGTAPNYTYSKHPSLINNVQIADDLIAHNGDISALEALYSSESSRYNLGSGSVSFTLDGLINPDTATVVVRDPASGQVMSQTNGAGSITGITPGTWLVEASAPGYTANTSPTVTVSAGQNTDAGSISFSVSTGPTLSSLSSNSGTIGSSITLTGTNFHNSIAGNTVEFGSTIATITSASPTELVVTVPGGISGNQNVRVTVGGTVSNSQSFSVIPSLTSLSSNSGAIGSTLTLTGTGFSVISAENTVRINGVSATVNAATATSLNITVPVASNGNVTVQVGGQTSSGIPFNLLPTVSFSSPLDNALLNGTTTLSVNTTSGNPISKVEYFSGATKLGESTAFPFSFNWNTTLSAGGAHTLTAKITDMVSNEVSSAPLNVTVNQTPSYFYNITASINPVIGLLHPTLLTCGVEDFDNTPTITWSTVGGDFGGFMNPSSPTTLDGAPIPVNGVASQIYWVAPDTAGGPYTIRCTADDGVNPPVSQDIVITVVSGSGNVTGNGGLF